MGLQNKMNYIAINIVIRKQDVKKKVKVEKKINLFEDSSGNFLSVVYVHLITHFKPEYNFFCTACQYDQHQKNCACHKIKCT